MEFHKDVNLLNGSPNINMNAHIQNYFIKVLKCSDAGRWIEAIMTVWPSGLRRWLKAPVRKGVGSNPTAVTFGHGAACRNLMLWLPLPSGCSVF